MRDLWSEYVRNGQAFGAENFLIVGPGLFGQIQLFNPLGSGVRVRLRSAHVSGFPTTAAVARHDVALATLGVPASFIVENLLGGGPAPVAEQRSVAGPIVGSAFWQVTQPGNAAALYPGGGREWGHDLLPGQGIHFRGPVASVIIINWHWAEVPL